MLSSKKKKKKKLIEINAIVKIFHGNMNNLRE